MSLRFMRIRTIALIGLVIIAAAAVAFGLALAGRGFSAREKPSWLEELLARNARKIATPTGARALKNPIAPTPENLAAAQAHWVDHCALCHGLDGSGNTPIGHNLYPPAPDLRDTTTQNLADGELYYVINNGIRLTGMPAWGGLHSEAETWQLVSFIRRLPHLTPEELSRMEQVAAGSEGTHVHNNHNHGSGRRPGQ
ncbi:MAG TPA: cytochrome c [Candidatus Acidoferrales bacterium]|nr:cytochrome c [Candidatus Acidoferrales bacterium]